MSHPNDLCDNVIMSFGWHTLQLLIHPDEISKFDFSQHIVTLQRFLVHEAGQKHVWGVGSRHVSAAVVLAVEGWLGVDEAGYEQA